MLRLNSSPLLGCLVFAIIFVGVSAVRQSKLAAEKSEKGSRNPRLFSLFNFVQFKQDPCSSTVDSTMSGTCMTATECQGASGAASGNCAAGFGVCCVFTATCGTGVAVSRNCTFLRNTQYPLTAPVSTTCSYTFNRICPNLCQIRLDFVNLVTAPPPIAGTTTGTCGDTVTVNGNPAVAANNPPVVCGTLSGQHMYLDTGIGTNSNAGGISIAFGATATQTRTYSIKVTYFTCDSTARLKAPAGCVQYFTGTSGTIQTYNFAGGVLLRNQNYQTCIRDEQGFCSVTYRQSAITTPDPFALLSMGSAGLVDPMSKVGVDCISTFTALVIPSTLSPAATFNRFCGGLLSTTSAMTVASTVTGNTSPFSIRTISNYADANLVAGTTGLTGYSLDFSQNSC